MNFFITLKFIDKKKHVDFKNISEAFLRHW